MALVGSSNEQKIWNYFKAKGFNDYATAGLIGNLSCESGLKSNNLQDTGNRSLGITDDEYVSAVDNGTYTKEQFMKDVQGFGLAQFTFWTRKKALYEFAKDRGVSIADLEMQLDFIYKELTESYKTVYNTLKIATSVLEASNVVLLKYENPADHSIAVQNQRASISQGFYDKYSTNSKGGDITMSICTYTKGVPTKLSANFISKEFDCHGNGCCSKTLHDPQLSKYLQQIRDHFGKPVTITSGYRCPTHNVAEGGAPESYHTKGMAADFYITGIAPAEIAKYAESIGILGIGLYPDFVHVDTRTAKYFWYGREQSPRTTFGGATISVSANSAISVSTSSTNPTYTATTTSTSGSYVVGKVYKTQVGLAVRAGAGTNYTRKTYSQLTLNAKKNATSAGYLKAGVTVTCLEVKKVGSDIWIRIPSGWCAAYYNGKYYIK